MPKTCVSPCLPTAMHRMHGLNLHMHADEGERTITFTTDGPRRPRAMAAKKPKKILRLSEFSSEPIDWIWPGWIAAGKVTLVDGDPGERKSLLTLDLVRRLLRGTGDAGGRRIRSFCPRSLVHSPRFARQSQVLPRPPNCLPPVHCFV